ncbi:MAG: hypothetical protein DRP42_05350 [Tenericutes bacterium]|nr:MAG: hypothetical protein DRP42_05350 [Mycoplasmatota bacterium]
MIRLKKRFKCKDCIAYCTWPRDRTYRIPYDTIKPPPCKGKGATAVTNKVVDSLKGFESWLNRHENLHVINTIRREIRSSLSSVLGEYGQSLIDRGEKGVVGQVRWYDLREYIHPNFSFTIGKKS